MLATGLMLAAVVFSLSAMITVFSVIAASHADLASDNVKIILASSFVDSKGQTNAVGTVRNFDTVPVEVTLGLHTDNGGTLQVKTYGRIVWPLTDSPFKFVLEEGTRTTGKPFIIESGEVLATRYNTLVLAYDGMSVGEDRAFVGTIKNTGPIAMHNVSVFAGAHTQDHGAQIDTIRSDLIPIIKPGEELEFVALPDPAVRSDTFYFSCAGIDFDAPITTVDAGDGKFFAFSMSALAEVSKIKYDANKDSMDFVIRPYIPEGGPLNLKLAQLADNHTVTVILDGKVAEQASVERDGKTLSIDMFVPQGAHEVQIQGARNIPELPFAMLIFAAMASAIVFFTRIRKNA
jgi:hypothetical protein